MLERLAKGAARFFVVQDIVKSEHEEIYAYGMEILLSTVINGIMALIIAAVTNTLLPSFIFFASFIIMRRTAGGYHANSHGGCMTILAVIQFLFILFIHICPLNVIPAFSIVSVVYSCISIYIFSPVEHPNKPLSDINKRKLRTQSIVFIICLSAVDILILLLDHMEISLYLSSGILVSTTGMIAEKITLVLENRYEKSER